MAKGGKQPGAGRPKGSTNRKQFWQYWSQEEIEEFVEFCKSTYMADMRTQVWVGEHLFGKAPQPITGADGGELVIQFDSAFKKENG